jgi:hypothetical protein
MPHQYCMFPTETQCQDQLRNWTQLSQVSYFDCRQSENVFFGPGKWWVLGYKISSSEFYSYPLWFGLNTWSAALLIVFPSSVVTVIIVTGVKKLEWNSHQECSLFWGSKLFFMVAEAQRHLGFSETCITDTYIFLTWDWDWKVHAVLVSCYWYSNYHESHLSIASLASSSGFSASTP